MLQRNQTITHRNLKNALIIYLYFCIFSATLMLGTGAAQTQGSTLFEQGSYDEAAEIFSRQLQSQPNDPTANFYLGRSLLAVDKPEEGIRFLKKAAQLQRQNADFHFWLGVGYWAVMDFKNEKQNYMAALELNPDHLSANLYLGHNYLDQNQLEQALTQYERVLAIDPDFPEAMYNRAIVLEKLGKSKTAVAAWHSYLNRYHSGKWAIQAVEQLKKSDDFSFRSYWFGQKNVVMDTTFFEPRSNRIKNSCNKKLVFAAETLQANPLLTLQIVTFVEKNAKLAEVRAKTLKRQILKSNPAVTPSRVKVSWFDVPEKIVSGNKTYVLKESVRFFTEIKNQNNVS